MTIKDLLITAKISLKKGLILFGLMGAADKAYQLLYILLRCKVLPLAWMDETSDNKLGILRPGQSALAYGPHYVGRPQETANVSLPDIGCYLFSQARISALSSSVVLNDTKVVIERALGPDQSKYNLSAGHIITHNQETAVVRLGKSENIEKGIFLCGNGSSNYYHWIVEILPRLEFLEKLPEGYRQYPLLVSEDVVSIPSFAETLELFAPGRELVILNKKKSYIVENLLWITSPNNLPFNLFGNQKLNIAYVTIDKLSIDFIRNTVLKNELTLRDSDRYPYPKKIFFCRKTEKRNYNQDEIFAYLEKSGFTKIFMEDLSFAEQVRTVYSADYLVGPTGAAWTNLIFCRSGAKALCWMAEEAGDFSAFSTIASLVSVDLRYVTYKSGVKQTSDIYLKDYIMEMNVIESAMTLIMAPDSTN